MSSNSDAADALEFLRDDRGQADEPRRRPPPNGTHSVDEGKILSSWSNRL
jgi:hypothetical protein